MYDEDDRYDLEDRSLGKWIGLTVVVGVIAAMGFTMLRDQQSRSTRASALAIETTAALEERAPTDPSDPAPTPAPTSTTVVVTTLPATATDDQLDANPVPTTTVVPVPPTPAAAPAPAPIETTTTAPPPPDVAYPAAPDGSPLPVIVTYDTGKVTLTGAVPSEDDRARLVGLAQANSQEPDVELVDNMFVNSAVPTSVGVRVIEMNSARFGEGEAQLLPEHTTQFDRVAAVLQALPHVTVLVVGHADQRGDDERNRELSENRASAVVDYLTYLGIEPTRLSMRGAGESDLLTLDEDQSALALNRRTEFVFYGALA
jgi:outer membrane protein OmpA-like peptidoglycan-associated protein